MIYFTNFFVSIASTIEINNQKYVAFHVEKKLPVDFRGQISSKTEITIGTSKSISTLLSLLFFIK